MNKVALFDFCETIANFQTADSYVDYVRERLNDKRMYRYEKFQNFLRKCKIIQALEIFTIYKFSINKRIKLWQLRGHSLIELQQLANDYYNERIRPNFIPEVLNRLLELKAQGYAILLVSGGYDIYLQYFVEEYDLLDVISTKIGFNGNVCTGKFDGIDCLRDGKTKLLNQYFKFKPTHSVGFSDSVTDLPFLKWVEDGYVISRDKHQEWSKKHNLKEIIWVEKRK